MDETPNTIGNTGSLPSAPPPPPEVKVRTMRSDLESMAKSGGGLPRFQNVAVSGLAIEKATDKEEPRKKQALFTVIVILAALIFVAAGIYYAYRLFFGTP